MDRNTTIGLILIGLLLTVFTLINQPSAADIKKSKENQKRELAKAKKEEATKKDSQNTTAKPSKSNKEKEIAQTTTVKIQPAISKTYVLENKDLHITFDSRGAIVSQVLLKKYKSYKDFVDKNTKALCLFKEGDASNYLLIKDGNETIRTVDKVFESEQKGNTVSFTYVTPVDGGENKKIIITYSLEKGNRLEYDIELQGYHSNVLKNTQLAWHADFRKTERLFKEQRRTTTVCYEQANNGFDYLSESSNDFQKTEDQINWLAYKQSYFTSILHPELGFNKANGVLQIKNFKDGHPKAFSHLKAMSSVVGLQFNAKNTASFQWYFGPNDYNQLASYDSNYDDILNYGWGIFRWINIYAVHPIFDILLKSGIGVGIAILLLTIILKLILMPIQWKMFVSSVKMRILKPEIEEINKKFPNKDDAMKKQVEMMSLYKESGASPLAGCVPMLIQMPILLAVFRFFPASFDLRQKSFLWAEDLSSFDSIWDFGFNLWPYGDHMSLFTLLMAGTTLLYTFMNSGNVQQPTQPGMPDMKVMMYIFPFMMIFFFNDYSSGLSYYYFISTLMSILIMVLIKQFFVNEDKLKLKMMAKKAASGTDKGPKKKSKFQERLEEMQKKSIEMQKNKKK